MQNILICVRHSWDITMSEKTEKKSFQEDEVEEEALFVEVKQFSKKKNVLLPIASYCLFWLFTAQLIGFSKIGL